ncbi:uncharacterized protein LOC131150421 [Malania oleifera]|uniref:uncharacterized protein LOC131150421 n=1 Tax=Malania oleifera TaxID=397392 RepID=UPI0025AEC2D9|nr:uncharacterized protein LOC131150421 [Malania oleifera]
MDLIDLKDRDFGTDLESGGGTTSEEDEVKDSLGANQSKTLIAKVCSAFGDGSVNGRDGVSSCCDVLTFSGVSVENVNVLTDKKLEEQETKVLVEKETVKEKRKKSSAKKPPRPPRGPSLDAADQKLIREINELAMLKRARVERMKALKRMKAAKASSSSSNLSAMLFTVFFCLVIFFQGMLSRSSPGFHGSPEPAAGTPGNFISVQYYRNSSAKHTNAPDSGSLVPWANLINTV